mgnify:CR=1 FL=1
MMAMGPDNAVFDSAQDYNEAQPFGALSRRIHARLVMQRAFLEALHIDPSLSECMLFRTISQDNAMALKEEYGA